MSSRSRGSRSRGSRSKSQDKVRVAPSSNPGTPSRRKSRYRKVRRSGTRKVRRSGTRKVYVYVDIDIDIDVKRRRYARTSPARYLSDQPRYSASPVRPILAFLREARSAPTAPERSASSGAIAITSASSNSDVSRKLTTTLIDVYDAADNEDEDKDMCNYTNEQSPEQDSSMTRVESDANKHVLGVEWVPYTKSHVRQSSAGSTPYLVPTELVGSPITEDEEAVSKIGKLLSRAAKKMKSKKSCIGCI